MTIQVSTTDARTARAIELLATADRWLKITSKVDGRRYYVVPGSNGRVYWVNLNECSCPDSQHRGIQCKHRIAVALHVAQVNAQPKRLAPKPAASAPECGGCNQERNRRRAGGRRLSQAERSPHTCAPRSDFLTAPSAVGTIGALDRARLVALADSIWGVDGE